MKNQHKHCKIAKILEENRTEYPLLGLIKEISSNECEFIYSLNSDLYCSNQNRLIDFIEENKQSSRRILVVDDQLLNLKFAKIMLSKMGHNIDTARGGKEAVKYITEKSYDLVLMDVEMPGMNGFSATREIRRLGYNNLPIIAFTSLSSKDDIQRCLDSGMNDHITKPANPSNLLTIIEKYK